MPKIAARTLALLLVVTLLTACVPATSGTRTFPTLETPRTMSPTAPLPTATTPPTTAPPPTATTPPPTTAPPPTATTPPPTTAPPPTEVVGASITPENTSKTLLIGDFTIYRSISISYVIGWVKNISASVQENVKVKAEIDDADGNVLGQGDDMMLALASLGPGQRAPFQVAIMDVPDTASRMHVTAVSTTYDMAKFHMFTPAANLIIEGQKLGKLGTFGTKLAGRVVNSGNKVATLVRVLALGLDADGKLSDVGSGYISGDLAVGDKSSFDLTFSRPSVKVDKVELLVIGLEK